MILHFVSSRSFGKSVLTAVLVLLLTSPALSKSKEIETSLEIPPGTWQVARLKSLPSEVIVHVEISSSEEINVLLVDQIGYSSFPDLPATPLFRGTVVNRLSFNIKTPHTDHYYLLIDNRDGKNKSSIHLKIRATLTSESSISGKTALPLIQTEFSKKMSAFVKKMQQIFIFDPVQVSVLECSKNDPNNNQSNIIFCADKIQELFKQVDNFADASSVLNFALLHEISHILFEQWQYPFADNCELADEFATVILIMLQHGQHISATYDYLLTGQLASDTISSLSPDSIRQDYNRRVQVILDIQENEAKRKRWLKFILPHLQKSVIDKILKQQAPKIELDKFSAGLTSDESNIHSVSFSYSPSPLNARYRSIDSSLLSNPLRM